MGEMGSLSEGTLEILASYSVDLNEKLKAFAESCRSPAGQLNNPLKKIKLSKEEGYRHYSAHGLGEQGVMALIDIANSGHLSNLESLSVSGEVLSREGIVLLPKLFETGQLINLQSLTLSDYRAGGDRSDEGSTLALAMAKSITSGMLKNLHTLDLSRNAFGDGCIEALAEALKSGHLGSLECFVLAQNDFGARGLVALAHALRSGYMSNLKTVYLHRSSVPEDEGITAIASTLEEGSLPVLKVISLFDGDHYKVHRFSVSRASMNALYMAYDRNNSLTAFLWDPSNAQWINSSNKLKNLQQRRERNESLMDTLKTLQDEPTVAGTHGKVFLCGNPRVGKTTLRRTLMSKWTDVFRNREEESTRGIEVAHMQSTHGPIQLALWDLAGQHEYQVLHSAFLPDLALGDGQAIFFIIVCKASKEDDHLSQQKQMLYWLRFISSNSTKDIDEHLRRRVLVLVNCFNNNTSYYHREAWAKSLADCRKEFGSFLNISPDPFVMSAQRSSKVMRLKNKLIHDAEDILKKSCLMPQICLQVQDSCRNWAANHTGYPVLRWQSYLNMMGRRVSDITLKAATLYLHQAGHVIFFKEGWESAETQNVNQEALVILDPEWFCQKVVGHVLLPEEMLRHGETSLRSLIEDDGSLPLTTLQTADLTVPEEKRQELVNILLRLGLCYQLQGNIAREKIFIPALMKDNLPAWYYEGSSASPSATSSGRSWVMGYSLVLKGSSWLTTLLPVALLRKLQVDLAQDEDMGGRSDSCYSARGSHITFKCRGMDVLVEYCSDPRDSEKERVDILVKPLVDASDELDDDGIPKRQEQVNLAHEIVDKILDIARNCCRGVELERRIIRPWSISDGYVPMMDRDIKMKVEAVIARVKQHGPQKTNWQVGNMIVWEDDLLSEEDLRTLYRLIDKRSSLIKFAVDKIVIPEAEVAGVSQPRDAKDNSSPSLQVEVDPQIALILQEIKGLGKKMDLLTTDVKGGLRKILERQKALVCQVQSLENFSVGLQENSWPRFAYLAKPGDPHSWIRVKEPFRESFKLHFLCEAPLGRHTLHEVKGQAGVDVKKLKDWARRLAPILDWTLKIAFVAANVASTAILPGLGIFLPSLSNNTIASEVQITQSVISDLTKYSCEAFSPALKHQIVSDSQATSLQEGGGSEGGVPTTSAMHHKLRGAARDAVNELLQALNSQEFKKQVGLVRVKLDRYGTSHVVWICHGCFNKHGHLVEI